MHRNRIKHSFQFYLIPVVMISSITLLIILSSLNKGISQLLLTGTQAALLAAPHPDLTPFTGITQVAGGDEHTCALTIDGTVFCWGRNRNGQLGDGTTTDRFTPVSVTGLSTSVQAIAAGSDHTCALTTAGTVFCWGNNALGQLGDGAISNRSTPVSVTGLSTGVQAITAGSYHTCALTTAGAVFCWGNNNDGQLGDGTLNNRQIPVSATGLSSSVQAITAGYSHTCALTNTGGVFCWGDNFHGQLGDESRVRRSTPVSVTGLGNDVGAITAGNFHTCALIATGGAFCWGRNAEGQLGDGTLSERLTPVSVMGLSSDTQSMVAGYFHTCALITTGGVFCWGSNNHGQLGDGTTTTRTTSVEVSGLNSDVQGIGAGYWHTCALTSADAVLCWGRNDYGQLGDGTTTTRSTPAAVLVDEVPLPTPTPTTNPNIVVVALPTAATAAQNTQVTIPIQVPHTVDGQAIIAYSFQINFDPTVLSIVGANTTDTLSGGWSVTPNMGTPGEVQIAAFNATPLSGSGTLLNLIFDVVGVANDTTSLTWANFLFNEGEPAVQTSDGFFTVVSWAFGGQVYYQERANRAISGVTLDLTGASTAQTITDLDGYSFTIEASGAHTITPAYAGPVNGITAFDAAYIAQCMAGLRNSTDCPLLAADTSGNSSLSAFDAALIAQYAAGLAGPTSRVGTWVFDPVSRSYAAIESDLLAEDFGAYLVGEVTGNWSAPATVAAQQAAGAAPLTALADDNKVTLQLSQPHAELLAFQATIRYDSSAGRFVAAQPTQALGIGWELVAHAVAPGVIVVVGYGTIPVTGNGRLVTLHFQANGTGQGFTPTITQAQLNEEPLWVGEVAPAHRQFLPLIVK